jgi:non-ribosomal peptide synthetase component F
LSTELTALLKRLAHQSGVSLFVVLLAAYKTLLHLYSGQCDLCLCVPVAGRNRVETRKLIGYFNNLVLVRTMLTEEMRFADLLEQVSQTTLGAFAHQALPLQQIAEALHIPGSVLSRAMFTLQNVPAPPTAMADVSITPLDMPEGISNFDLSLSLKMQDGHLLGVLRYKTDLFQPAAMSHLLEHFHLLLHNLAANSQCRLTDLPRPEARPPAAPDSAAPEALYVAPQSELEHTIAAIWQTVLRRDQISVEANFFALGGRSLDLVQIRSKIQEVLQQDIPLQDLFQLSTIRLLAHSLGQKRDVSQSFAQQTQQRTQDQRKALQRQQEQMQRRRKLHG